MYLYFYFIEEVFMKSIRLLIISSLMVVAFGCSVVSVQYDYDTKADFASLKTFYFMPVPEKANINSLNVKRIQDAVSAQLATKGCRMSDDNPDFLIAMHLTKKDKTDVQFTDHRLSLGSYVNTPQLQTYQYVEGTFVLDFVGTQSKALIWRGVARGEMSEDLSREKRIKKIDVVIQKVLSNFPPSK